MVAYERSVQVYNKEVVVHAFERLYLLVNGRMTEVWESLIALCGCCNGKVSSASLLDRTKGVVHLCPFNETTQRDKLSE